MNRKISSIMIIFLFILNSLFVTSIVGINTSNDDVEDSDDEGWYYLPKYDNYAPSGLPDFDQKQQSDWGLNEKHPYVFCGPVSLANVLWWFDSKNSDPEGFPGDGNDFYPLVSKYTNFENPISGPNNDDHLFENVNNVNTSWKQNKESAELIEKLAWYCDISWFKIPFFKIPGVDPFQMKLGFKKWLREAGLKNHYKFKLYFRPSFSLVCDHIENNDGVILMMAFYTPESRLLSFTFGHYVAVAGVNREGGIAISDPFYDKDTPIPKGEDFTYHNNASIVSHDHYNISYDSPTLFFSDWWLPDYLGASGGLISCAIVISQEK